MAKNQPDYLTASAMREYTPSYSTQAVPQLQFAQYAWNDPKFALGMLLGNLGGQYLGSKLEKDAAQRQFRQDNPTAIPDDAKLFDVNSIPTNANGNQAVGTAYNKFNGDNGVSNDFLTNLQNVQGKLQYDPATQAATGYQTPAFLPSMQADNNLQDYFSKNFNFANYLNGQTAPNGGQGLLNFSQLQAMAGGNNAADNPVSQSMGVLPTANVQTPTQADASIPAITGRLGNPINGSLNMNTSALSLPWQGKFDYLKKAGDDVAASSPADGTAAPQPITDTQPIKDEQPIKSVEGPIRDEQPIKEQSDQTEQKQPEMVDNPQYVALRTLMNKEKDPKKKAAMAAELNNIPAKVENWSWGPSNEIDTSYIDNTPEPFSAADRENEFVRSELMRGTPASVINAVVSLARPQWQAKEQAYNRYQESQLYPAYYTAAALGNYPAAAQIAQGMEQYNPQLSAAMIAGLPTGLNFYSTQVAKEKAAQAQQYKQKNMQVQHGYDIDRDNNNSRNRITQSRIDWKLKQIYTSWEMAEKRKYDNAKLSEKIAMLQNAGMSYNDAVRAAYGAGVTGGRRGTTGGSGGEKISDSDKKAMNEVGHLYQRAMQLNDDGTLDADAVDALQEYVNKNADKYDEDTFTKMNAMAAIAQATRAEKDGASADTVSAIFSQVPRYLLEQMIPERNWDGYQ